MTNTSISKKMLLVPPVILIVFLLFCYLFGGDVFSSPGRYADADSAAKDIAEQATNLDKMTEARKDPSSRDGQNKADKAKLKKQEKNIKKLEEKLKKAAEPVKKRAEEAKRKAEKALELVKACRTIEFDEVEDALKKADVLDGIVDEWRRACGETYDQARDRLKRSIEAGEKSGLTDSSTAVRDKANPAINRAEKQKSSEPVDTELRDKQREVDGKVKKLRDEHGKEIDDLIAEAEKALEEAKKAQLAKAKKAKEHAMLSVPGPVYASVQVREEEKAYLATQIGGQVVAQVLVNDKPRELPKLDEGIPVNPGDVVQAISALGNVLARIDFTPKVVEPPPTRPPVKECPLGKPAVVSVPGNYTGVPLDNMQVSVGTTGPKEAVAVTTPEAALVTGEEKKAAAVTTPEAAVTTPSQLAPVLKTDDTVVAAGALDNSAIGSNAISVTDKNTGAVLGQTQVDTWRLAGASLNPPVVNKGQDTNLRLDVFGPPDLPMKVTATAGEGLTPKQLTATAPIGVLQSQGLGAFTATQSGQHNVSVRATAAAGCTRTKHCGCGGTPQPRCAHKECGCEVGQVSPMLPEQVSPMLK